MKSIFIVVFSILAMSVMSGCVFDKGTTLINFGNKPDPYLVKKAGGSIGDVNATISTVAIVNDQLVINGSGLDNIDSITLNGNSFAIESKSSSNIVANGAAAFSYVVGQIFDLVLSNAYGAATYQVTFTLSDNTVTTSKIVDGQVMTADLADGAVTAAKLSTAGATAGSVIQFDGTNWGLVNLNGLTYQGTWNASTNSPSLSDASGNCNGYNPGDYFAVSVTGSTFIDGENSWAAGDWIICSNGAWDKVINTTNITSVFGRTGAVTATLSDMTDVDSSLTSVDGQLLIYRNANSRYETANFLDFDWATGNATFSNNVTITGTGFTVGGKGVCYADGSNCTFPTPTQVVNNSGPAVVNSSSGIDPVNFQIGGTTEVQIDTTGKLITGEFQVQTGAGAGKYLGSDISGNATWKDIATSEVTGLDTALASKVAKADVAVCTDPTKQLVWDGTNWSCLAFTDNNTNAATLCNAGEYLDGDGTCKSVAAGGADNSQAGNVQLIADNDSNASGEIQFMIGATTPMVLDNAGNLGIGTATPGYKMDVMGTSRIAGNVHMIGTLRSYSGALDLVSATDALIFRPNSTEAMRIDTSGNVGIGTNAPTAGSRLDVQGGRVTIGNSTTAATNQIDIYHSDLAQTWISLKRGASTKANLTSEGGFMIDLVPQGASGTGYLRLSGNTAGENFTIRNAANSPVARFYGDQKTVLDGTVAIGTATPLASTSLTVAGGMKVTSGNDICIDGGNCLSAMSSTTGDITGVNTATGSGLTGGVATGTANLAVDVDGSTLEVDGITNKVRIKDSGVTDAKVVGVGVQKITSGVGNYFTYAPAGSACGLNQVLKLDGSGNWVCANDLNTEYTGGDGLTLTGTDFSVNVDGSTIETNADTLRVKDGGITDAKISGVGVQKVVSSAGNYFTYAPNNVPCAQDQFMVLNASGQWVCGLAKVNSLGDLDARNFKNVYLERTLPTVVDDIVEIGKYYQNSSAQNLDIAITVGDSGFSVSKRYLITGNYCAGGNCTDGEWYKVVPLQDTGSYGGNDFDLDIMQNNSLQELTLRIRRVLGSTSGTASVYVSQIGRNNATFTAMAGTSSVTAPANIYPLSTLTSQQGKIGIGKRNPASALDVAGTVTGTAFVGDGSGLTGVTSTSADNTGDLVLRADTDTNTSGEVKFFTNGTQKAVIDNAGNLGVGVLAPGAKFEVTQTSGGSSTAIFNMVDNTANNFVVRQGGNDYINVDTTNGAEKITLGNTTTNPNIDLQGLTNFRSTANQVNIFDTDGADPLDSYILNFDNGKLDFVFKDNSAGPSYKSYLNFDGAGRVGVLTATPDSYFHIYPPGDAGYMKVEGVDDGSNFAAIELESDEATDKKWAFRHASGANLNDLMFSFHNGSAWSHPFTFADNGRLGIGTTTPSTSLHVKNGEINIQGTEALENRMSFRASDDSQRFRILTDLDGTTGNDILKFRSTSSDNQLVLKGNGNVGIGQADPYAKLDINAGSYSGTVVPLRAAVKASVTPSSSNGYSLFEGIGGTTFSGGTVYGLKVDMTGGTAGVHYGVYADGENRNYFSGNVGVGQTIPTSKLHITGTGGYNQGLTVSSTGANSPAVGLTAGAATPDAGYLLFGDGTGWKFHFGRRSDDGATKYMTINDSGKVGIGFDSPGTGVIANTMLHVARDGDVFVTASSTNNSGVAGFAFDGAGDRGSIYGTSTYDIHIEPNAQYGQADIIMNSKNGSTMNVGIGTTTPEAKLHTNGSVHIGGSNAVVSNRVITDTAGNIEHTYGLNDGSATSNHGRYYLSSNSSYEFDSGNDAGGLILRNNGGSWSGITGGTSLKFLTGGTSTNQDHDDYSASVAMEINSSGNVTINGDTTINGSVNGRKIASYGTSGSYILGDHDWSDQIRSGTQVYDAVEKGMKITTSGTTIIRTRLPVDAYKTYRAEVTMKKIDGTGTIYIGADSLDANFTGIYADTASSYNYFAAGGYNLPAGSEKTFVGYISGYNTVATGDPTKFDPGAKYWDLVLIANYTGSGNTVVKSIKIEEVDTIREDDQGRIGIGTNSPDARLHITDGSANGSLRLDVFQAGGPFSSLMTGSDFGSVITGGDNGQMVMALKDNDVNDGFHIISGGGNYMADTTYDKNVFSAKSDGKIGIGLNNPSYGLHVNNQSTANTGAMFIGASLNGSGKGLVIDSATRTTAENTTPALEIINRAGTNTMTATVEGNVGIGSTNPNYKLHVLGNDVVSRFESAGNVGLDLVGSDSLHQFLRFYGGSTGRWEVGNDPSDNFYINNIVAGGSSSSEFLVTSSGNVGIGTNTPARPLDVNGGAHFNYTSSGATVHVGGSLAATSWVGAGCEVGCESAGGYSIMYPTSVAVSTFGWTTTSDARLKEEVEDVENVLDKIEKVRAVEYFWRDREINSRKEIGVIAQEIQAVFPELVHTTENGFLTVDYPRLGAIALEGINELHKQIKSNLEMFAIMNGTLKVHEERISANERAIASLKEENEKLKDENEKLKKRLEAIEKHLGL